jgi:hypothetical protein
MKSQVLLTLRLLPLVVLTALTSRPAVANEVSVPLVRLDEYASRAVKLISKDRKEISECTNIFSYDKRLKAFVCVTVSGARKSFLVGHTPTVLFPLSTKQAQGQVFQQAKWTKIGSKPKEEVVFSIPEQSMKISTGSLLLNSSWMLSPKTKSLSAYSELKGKVESVEILEPSSLTYQPAEKIFIFKGRYVQYTKETIETKGGGGGGKGSGRSRRSN